MNYFMNYFCHRSADNGGWRPPPILAFIVLKGLFFKNYHPLILQIFQLKSRVDSDDEVGLNSNQRLVG
jgi:hypothetical protein